MAWDRILHHILQHYRGEVMEMKFTENLNCLSEKRNKTARIIPDGDPVPKPGDVIEIYANGKWPRKVRVVGVKVVVRQHKSTMYSIDFKELEKQK